MKSPVEFTRELVANLLKSKSIAPVDSGDNTIRRYSVGDKFVRNGVLYKAKQSIAINTPWSSLTLNTDYEEDTLLVSQIQALTNEVDSIIQESVFTIEEEDGVLYLDWHGAAGECPYSTQLIGTNYELIFTYETT